MPLVQETQNRVPWLAQGHHPNDPGCLLCGLRPDARTNGYSHANASTYVDGHPHSHPGADIHVHCYTNVHTYPDTHPHSNIDVNTYSHAYPHADSSSLYGDAAS